MPITVFQLNDCDWWAGSDLESVKSACAESYGYPTLADCEADGLIDDPRPLTDEEMDRLQFDYNWPDRTHRVSFRLRLQELVASQASMPCFFASTEY